MLDLFWARSFQSHVARKLLAAGAFAGTMVVGACADGAGKSVTAPPAELGPRAITTSSGGLSNAAKLTLCVSSGSPAGTYTFKNNSYTEGGAPYNDPAEAGGGGDPFLGSTVENEADGVGYDLAPGGCTDVLTRTAPSEFFPTPNAVDPYSVVTVSYFSNTAGAPYDHTDCVVDEGITGSLLPTPAPCGTGNQSTTASINYAHGVVLTYYFTPAATHNCTYTQGYYKNHEVYTAGVLSSNAGTTYIDGAGLLIIGSYLLSAAQVDAILGTAVGKGYNSGGVVFSKAQLGMIHQLITAELNLAGGADGSSVVATITAANAGYTSASKSTLSSWTNTLDNFNNGNSGPPHCS